MASLKEDMEEFLGVSLNDMKERIYPAKNVTEYKCGHIEPITKDSLWTFYHSDNYAVYRFISSSSMENKSSMPQILADVIDTFITQPRILVHGCGDGIIPLGLRAMNFENITITDVPNKFMGFLKYISNKYGLNFKFIELNPWDEYPLKDEYDFIILNETVSHACDPEINLRYLFKLLANNGSIYLNHEAELLSGIAQIIGLKPKYKDNEEWVVFQRSADKFTGIIQMINFYPAPLKGVYEDLGISISETLSKHGYIINNRNLYPAMESMPYSTKSILLATPYSFLKTNSEKSIGFTMFDATTIPKSWVQRCNIMDQILVPCLANAEWFKTCGVTAPIELIPVGVNTDIFNPYTFDKEIESRYYFGHENIYEGVKNAFKFLVINDGSPKKNNQMVLDAFREEFSEEIANNEIYLIFNIGALGRDSRGVININKPSLADREIARLIYSCDCVISASSGEAVDMPVLQGMALEKPVIVSEGFAHSECVTNDTGYFIETDKWVPAHQLDGEFDLDDIDGAEWVIPDLKSLREKMRVVYEYKGNEVGMRARKRVLTNYTQDIMAKKIIEILEKAG